MKKSSDVWNGIKHKIKEVNDSECDCEKDYMKIKFNSDDNLPLKKPLKFHNIAITIRSVFEEDGKLYSQLFLDDTLYELDAYRIFRLYTKMSRITDLTYYQRNKDLILNKKKITIKVTKRD